MKKRRILALLGALLAAAAGCAAQAGQSAAGTGETYLVYYSALSDPQGASAVEGEPRTLSEGQAEVPALFQALLAKPSTQGLSSPFPTGLRLLDWTLEEGQLHLDLSEQYYTLSGVDLTLADACLTLTLCQLEGVDSVYVTVEGDELPYRSMQHLSDGDILLDGGADEPMALDIELWYLTAGGRGLGVERRQIVKTVEQTVAEAVLSAWAEGPRQEGLLPCLPQGSQIRSVELRDGVCAVDLSQEFLQGLPEEESTAALMVYAMVNTLCQLEGVDAVQLYIDGSPAPAVGGLPLDQALIPDTTLGAGG